MADQEWILASEVARRLGVSRFLVYRAKREGRIMFKRVDNMGVATYLFDINSYVPLKTKKPRKRALSEQLLRLDDAREMLGCSTAVFDRIRKPFTQVDHGVSYISMEGVEKMRRIMLQCGIGRTRGADESCYEEAFWERLDRDIDPAKKVMLFDLIASGLRVYDSISGRQYVLRDEMSEMLKLL